MGEAYSEYFKKIENVDGYFERIGLKKGEKIPVTREGLDKLVLAHVSNVPFENLDIYEHGIKPDLSVDALYDKIVIKRRGGYCFEQNALFMSLLETLGFDVFPVGARVSRGDFDFKRLSHRATIATIEGVRYLCDVGFGGPVVCGALPVDDNSPYELQGDVFSVEQYDQKNKILIRHKDGDREPIYIFAPEQFFILDFVALSFFMAGSSDSNFTKKRMANLRTDQGSVSIDDNIFRSRENGVLSERVLNSEAELEEILKSRFGLNVSIKRTV